MSNLEPKRDRVANPVWKLVAQLNCMKPHHWAFSLLQALIIICPLPSPVLDKRHMSPLAGALHSRAAGDVEYACSIEKNREKAVGIIT